ncbi:common pilus major fimbrillin subunit EcpA [Salmonella enterica]
MKFSVLTLSLLTSLSLGTAQAADTSAQAVASWAATATKDTTNRLVVNPLGNLVFQFSQGDTGFSPQSGLFDVSIEGDNSATAFKLTSRLLANTLTRIDGSGSTLDVGVNYNGTQLTKAADTMMVDTNNGVGGNLSSLANSYNTPGRSSAQADFFFTIDSATSDGTTAVTDYSQLPDGNWIGDVRVQFDATWTS